MAKSRKYSNGVIAALYSLCRGTCYWPDCQEPVVDDVEGDPIFNLEIAHIYALERNGPRYNESMSDEERNSFSNLILLCSKHHKRVDGVHRDRYPAELLMQWKAEREAPGQAALKGLRGLTEERLQELISGAYEEFSSSVSDALARFEQVDSEAANLLRVLIDELTDSRLHSLGIDQDAVSLLHGASYRLQSLPDTVELLASIATDLRNFPHTVELLAQVTEDLAGLSDAVETFANSARSLAELSDMVNLLAEIVPSLQNLPDTVLALQQSIADARRYM